MAELDDELKISDDTIKSQQEYTSALKDLLKSLDGVIIKGEEHQKVIGDTKSTKKLTEEVNKLIKENEDLIKSQKVLDGQIKKLDDDNKKLAKSVDDLTKKQKKQEEETKKLSESVDTLDNRTGGYIGRVKQLGKELMVLAASPVVLMLATVILLLTAAANSVKTFFTATGEGEDMLARQSAVWGQFFNTLKKGWAELGESIAEFFGDGTSQGVINGIFEAAKIVFPFLYTWLSALQVEFNRTAKEAMALADTIDGIEERIAANIVTRALTNKKYNELILQSQDTLLYSDQQRLAILQEAIATKERQLQIDLAIAKDQAAAVLYQIGLEHSLTKAQVDKMTEQEKLAKFTGKEMKKIAEATAHVIDLEAGYAAEVKKASKQILALKKEIYDAEIKALMDTAEKRTQALVDQVEAEIKVVRDKYIAGEIATREEADKQIMAIRKRNADDVIALQISELEKILALNKLNAEDRAKVEKLLHDYKIKLSEAQYDAMVTFDAIEIEATKTKLQVVAELYNSLASSLSQVFGELHENRMRELDEQQSATEAYYNNQIEMAGDNTKKRKELENDLEKEMAAIERRRLQAQRRAAIFEKAVALVQAAINIGLAATNQGAKGDPYTAFARVGAIVAALGPFVALIAAKDVPKYEKGGITKQRRIIAGEKGIERYETPSGEVGYTPNRATLMDLPVGTKITNNKQTLRDLAMDGINPGGVIPKQGDPALKESIDKGFAELNNTVKSKKETSWSVSRRGVELMVLNAQGKTKYLNDRYK